DDGVRRHTELTEQVAELSQQLLAHQLRLEAARVAAEKIAAITDDAREAKLIATAAAATSGAS
ncbi:hypothetical protein, partial [Mycobacterium tuberculosis]